MGFLDPLFDATVPHALPLSSGTAVTVLSGGYLVAMIAITLLAPQKPMQLRWLSLGHNSLLCLYSLYSFLGFVTTLAANYAKSMTPGLSLFFCDRGHEMVGGNMDYWVYHFYLSKVFEWVDTAMLILRGKQVVPPANVQFGLHLFHHTTAISIVWTTWRYPISTSWIGPLTNSFVHVIMYGYYALTDVGLSRRWGLIITPLQLGQFVLCLVYVTWEWVTLALWGQQGCDNNPYTLAWVYACYFVFLYLFFRMYSEKRRTLGGSATTAGRLNGHKNGLHANGVKKTE
jgi:hypothetical protein